MKVFNGFKVNYNDSKVKFFPTRKDAETALDASPEAYSLSGGSWLVEGTEDEFGFYYQDQQITSVTRAQEIAFVHYSENQRRYFITDSKVKTAYAREFLEGRININCHLSVVEELIQMRYTNIDH